MNNTKNFSWILKVRNPDGTIDSFNESNPQKGYRQSWYKTPKSAMKKLQEAINYEKSHSNREIIESYCFTSSGKTF